ncbi:MAG: hypothetical protein ACM3KR_07150 [Deltaproteobacteria bacterium]
MTKSWIPQEHDFTDFFELPIKLRANEADEPDMSDEAVFHSKLMHLSLLYDVPFSYLVPSEKMLGMNEIRFFWLDSNWIRLFLDGACSLGRSASIDYTNDTVFLKNIFNEAIKQNMNIRRMLQNKEPIKSSANDNYSCTGFLLRSPLVGGWRGLEFIAYADLDGTQKLTTLRLETLSAEILLGIFSGEIIRLDIKEPPEGFHYGFNKEADGKQTKLSKRLRTLDSGKLYDDLNIPIEERESVVQKEKKTRVINFSAAAKEIKKGLFPNSEEAATSAHIALEMIQNPYMLKIKQN